MYWCKWYYVQKAGSAPVNGDIKTSAGAVFNIPICKVEHQRCYFFFASERHKTVAATEKRIKLFMI
jgi:23S rRNA (guanosine2251-2'-O)-methyltransferase